MPKKKKSKQGARKGTGVDSNRGPLPVRGAAHRPHGAPPLETHAQGVVHGAHVGVLPRTADVRAARAAAATQGGGGDGGSGLGPGSGIGRRRRRGRGGGGDGGRGGDAGGDGEGASAGTLQEAVSGRHSNGSKVRGRGVRYARGEGSFSQRNAAPPRDEVSWSMSVVRFLWANPCAVHRAVHTTFALFVVCVFFAGEAVWLSTVARNTTGTVFAHLTHTPRSTFH